MHCICPLSPNPSTKVAALDFTLINCLIKTSRQTPPAGNPQWITDVLEIRNQLSHIGDQSTLTDQKISEWWKKLEEAVVNIAGTVCEPYQERVKRRIDKIKRRQSELHEMLKALKTRDDDFEKKILDALQNMGVRVGEVPFQITKTEFLKEQPQISLATPFPSSTNEPNKCIVVWTFSSSGEWDVEKMQQKLEQMNRLGDFDIQFVYRGSLILHTQADPDIISTAERFKESIEEFLFLFANLLQIQEPTGNSLAIAIAIWHKKTVEDVKEDDSMPRTPVYERDRKIGPGLSKSDDDMPSKPVDERERKISPGSSKSEDPDTTGAQVIVTKPQLPRELKKIKQLDMSGILIDCTAVDDKLLICNFLTNRLAITDSDGSNMRNICLSGSPLWVTAINNTTVAVNIGDSDIDIINIYSGDRMRRTSVDGYVLGLTYSEPHLYIVVRGKGIHVIDLHGYIVKIIPTGMDALNMTTNKQSIYYTQGDAVLCVATYGAKIWALQDPMIKAIRGLTTDGTNIYATCRDSNTVFVISHDGKQVRQLLSETDGLRYPQGICYNRKSKTLMVCNYQGPAFLFNIVK